jgi:superfamily II DNA or RNA helicase
VEYHLGYDFIPNDGELIVVDEIDTMMFKDPIKFNKTINGCLVLGFTATPDNFNSAGGESRITNLLKFKKFHYVLGQQD